MDAAAPQLGPQPPRSLLGFPEGGHGRGRAQLSVLAEAVATEGEHLVQLVAPGIEGRSVARVAHGFHGRLDEGGDVVPAPVPALARSERRKETVPLRGARVRIGDAQLSEKPAHLGPSKARTGVGQDVTHPLEVSLAKLGDRRHRFVSYNTSVGSVSTSQSRPSSLPLIIVGGGLAAIAALGLVSILWLGGPDPSLWFIITAGGAGKTISGWTVTLTLVCALAAGTSLLAIGRRRRP